MKLKKYNTPDIEIMEMTTVSMIAGSGDGLYSDGTGGNIGGPSGGNGTKAHIASRQYFDGWDLDDADEE